MNANTFPRTGTTSPIFIRRDPNFAPLPVTAGEDYFLIQVCSAQAAFRGHVWDNIKKLVVTSQVNLNHHNLDNKPMRAIQRTRDVQKNQSQPLGLSPNLVSLVPAVMPNVSLSIDFILDRENRLAQIGGLINSDSFTSVLSLAPGASAIAKTVAQLTDKIIQTFIPAQESKPLLEFSGDFNLATKQLRDGYYVILGSKDDQNPLPDPTAKYEVTNGGLLVNGQPATPWSYIILNVQRTDIRPRELNDAAPWDAKLREAEDTAQSLTMNPLASDEERKSAWNTCFKLIEQAQTLLRADDNFLPKDTSNIISATLVNCRKLLDSMQTRTRGTNIAPGSPSWTPALTNDLTTLGLPANVDLIAMTDKYADQVIQTRRT